MKSALFVTLALEGLLGSLHSVPLSPIHPSYRSVRNGTARSGHVTGTIEALPQTTANSFSYE